MSNQPGAYARASSRPAWVEIDLGRLEQNFRLIRSDNHGAVKVLAVVKDEAYGHGAVPVARAALANGAWGLATATVDEALALRAEAITAPVLVFGERTSEELEICLRHDLLCHVNDLPRARELNRLAVKMRRRAGVHIEIDTGMSRYGVRWEKAAPIIAAIAGLPHLQVAGVMSHFARSDEADKSFALLQLQRFQQVLRQAEAAGIAVGIRHMCNTGGYLDLPQAHFDMVRMGILPLGVYPSQVCRRIPGLQPVMQVKTRVAAIQEIQAGDTVGYGMRFTASGPCRIAVLPIGYGDGLPRLRNTGCVLVHGRRAPIVGGNAMDATMVDITAVPQVRLWDEVVMMGAQGKAEISVHEIAGWKGSVSYDILAGWRWRLPRVYKNEGPAG